MTGSRGAAQNLLSPVVELFGAGAKAADHLVRQPRRLLGDRVAELGLEARWCSARCVSSLASTLSVSSFVLGLARAAARAARAHRSPRVGNDALEHTVADERTGELLRQRAGK